MDLNKYLINSEIIKVMNFYNFKLKEEEKNVENITVDNYWYLREKRLYEKKTRKSYLPVFNYHIKNFEEQLLDSFDFWEKEKELDDKNIIELFNEGFKILNDMINLKIYLINLENIKNERIARKRQLKLFNKLYCKEIERLPRGKDFE